MAPTIHTLGLARAEEALTVLFHRRRLRVAQPSRSKLRIPQATLGLGGHRVCVLSPRLSAAGRERSFLRDAERFSLICSLGWGRFTLPRSWAGEEAQALPGAPAPGDRLRAGRRAGDPNRRSTLLSVLHARQVGQSAGFEGATWVRGGHSASTVGSCTCLRNQSCAHLLRTHPRQRCRRLADRGTAWRCYCGPRVGEGPPCTQAL
jgi:hypothetical protein